MYNVHLERYADDCAPGQVLGGGPCMWGEYAWGAADSEMAFIFPRALAAGEVLWASPADRSIN